LDGETAREGRRETEIDVTDAFSEYVALLDDVQEIPLAARESPELSTEQRAATVARVVRLVHDRVLPQSDREQAGLDTLFYGGMPAIGSDRGSTTRARETILTPAEELARVDPRDEARVQALLYRLHAAIASRFREAEVIVSSAAADEPPPMQHRSRPPDAWSAPDPGERDRFTPSGWFG
jgi:hypothetical protein